MTTMAERPNVDRILRAEGQIGKPEQGVARRNSPLDRRAELARLARQRVESHFTFEHRMARVVDVYYQALGIDWSSRRNTTRRRAA